MAERKIRPPFWRHFLNRILILQRPFFRKIQMIVPTKRVILKVSNAISLSFISCKNQRGFQFCDVYEKSSDAVLFAPAPLPSPQQKNKLAYCAQNSNYNYEVSHQ